MRETLITAAGRRPGEAALDRAVIEGYRQRRAARMALLAPHPPGRHALRAPVDRDVDEAAHRAGSCR